MNYYSSTKGLLFYNTLAMLLVVIVLPGFSSAQIITATISSSPYDLGQTELASNPNFDPGLSPVEYTTAFTRERELYGYNPRFMPAIPTFDQNNRPFIIASVTEAAPATGNLSATRIPTSELDIHDVVIQTVNQNNDWISISAKQLIKDRFSALDVFSGTHQTPQMYFDDENHAYALVKGNQQQGWQYLLYSSDPNLVDWNVYRFTADDPRFEKPSGSAVQHNGTPVISHMIGGDLVNWQPIKTETGLDRSSNGRIYVADTKNYTTVAESGDFLQSNFVFSPLYGPAHSGKGNATATIGETTVTVFASLDDQAMYPGGGSVVGTPQYAARYDGNTGATPDILIFGEGRSNGTNDSPDVHNAPTIVTDSLGFGHIITGAHNDHMYHYISTSAIDDPSWDGNWDSGVSISDHGLGSGNGGLTYPSLVIDSDDTLHLVARDTEGSGYKLAYLRATEDAGTWTWENDDTTLVDPDHVDYSIYYHELAIDRSDNLYLSYSYYADDLTAAEQTEYDTKWPNDPRDPGTGDIINSGAPHFAHDPVLLASTDSGTSWQLATTSTFTSNMAPSLMGDFNSDDSVNGLDFLAWQRGESPSPLSQTDLDDWRNSFGTVSPSSNISSVPEPSSLVLLMGTILLAGSRLRSRS